uniref:Uncharacterized protein n=1 Tax=Arundo donax TaxID=35708 RepID=A0A0A9B371_ARUDO
MPRIYVNVSRGDGGKNPPGVPALLYAAKTSSYKNLVVSSYKNLVVVTDFYLGTTEMQSTKTSP